MPMKMIVYFVSFCLLAICGFSANAQKIKLAINDTTYVPVVEEIPTFQNHNYVYKARLDSIEKTVPLTYNEFVQNYIDIYSGRKDMMGKMIGLSDYYFPIFERALKNHDIPDEIKYLPIIESSMNSHAVSRVGATGLWQFMFATAKDYGLHMDNFVDERKDPIQASNAAAAYFKDAYEELGDWLLAIAAYNCGMGNVNRAIAKADSRDFWEIRRFLPMETRNYVPAFIAAVYVMNYSGTHQIKAQRSALFKGTDIIEVKRFVALPSLAEALNVELEELAALNPSYKKKIVNGTEESPKRLILPKVDVASFARVYELLNHSDVDVDKHIVLAANDGYQKKKSKDSAKPKVVYHKVTPGQNLITIANKYRVEVQDLKVWNNLKGSTIVPGQRLKIYSNLEGRHMPAHMRG